jgi:hypothetical protein
MRASETAELIFENCRVHKSQVLGNVGDGFKQAMKVLDGGRISIAALSLGVEYYGIDPLTSDRVNEMIKYFGGKGFAVKECSEKLDYSIFPNVHLFNNIFYALF